MMRRKSVVYCIGEDPDLVVQKKQNTQDDEHESSKLKAGTNLAQVSVSKTRVARWGSQSFSSLWALKFPDEERCRNRPFTVDHADAVPTSYSQLMLSWNSEYIVKVAWMMGKSRKWFEIGRSFAERGPHTMYYYVL